MTDLQIATTIIDEPAWIASLADMKPSQLDNELNRLGRLWRYHHGYPGPFCDEAARLIGIVRQAIRNRQLLERANLKPAEIARVLRDGDYLEAAE